MITNNPYIQEFNTCR